MPEYIERDAALAKIEWLAQMTGDSGREHGLRAAIEVLQACAAADVEPVRHGRWIEKPYLLGTSNFCSECGANYGMPHGKFRFCPDCGTKMDRTEAADE